MKEGEREREMNGEGSEGRMGDRERGKDGGEREREDEMRKGE